MIEHYIREFEEELREIRHQIHENPELGLQEFKTSALVAEKLRQWGYEVEQGLATTGVVATLKVGDGEKSIGLRADMDALPIYENSGKPWHVADGGFRDGQLYHAWRCASDVVDL